MTEIVPADESTDARATATGLRLSDFRIFQISAGAGLFADHYAIMVGVPGLGEETQSLFLLRDVLKISFDCHRKLMQRWREESIDRAAQDYGFVTSIYCMYIYIYTQLPRNPKKWNMIYLEIEFRC